MTQLEHMESFLRVYPLNPPTIFFFYQKLQSWTMIYFEHRFSSIFSFCSIPTIITLWLGWPGLCTTITTEAAVSCCRATRWSVVPSQSCPPASTSANPCSLPSVCYVTLSNYCSQTNKTRKNMFFWMALKKQGIYNQVYGTNTKHWLYWCWTPSNWWGAFECRALAKRTDSGNMQSFTVKSMLLTWQVGKNVFANK